MRWFWIGILRSVIGRGALPGGLTRDIDEVELARRLASGDADAFGALYDRHARSVFSLAFRILGDQAEAEDVAQEVFTQAWRQAGRYDASRGQPVAWLLNMTRSRAIDALRRRRHVTVGEEGLPELAEQADADLAVITADQTRALRVALASLPALQRAAIELAYFEGLSQTEIAERLDQPLGTVKTRVRLGLVKLREAIAGSRA